MIPKLPSERQLAAALRATHEAFSHTLGGGEYVGLHEVGELGWVLESPPHPDLIGREYVPGDGAKFDALAAARRLLFAAREAGFR